MGSARGTAARASAGSSEIRVVTAVPVTPERRNGVAARLHQALGEQVDIAFAEDSALLAGAEIHLPAAVVRHSWREQLAQAQHALKAP